MQPSTEISLVAVRPSDRELHFRASSNTDADSLETFLSRKCDGNSPGKSEVDCEESRGLLNSHIAMAGTDASGIFNPLEEQQQDTAVSRTNLTSVSGSLEGLVDASFQETSKSIEALKAAVHCWEKGFLLQSSLLSRKEEEVAALQRENQNLRGCVTELRSHVAQDTQTREMVSKLKTESQRVRDHKGKSFGQTYRDQRALHEDLRKCQGELESAKNDVTLKTSEIVGLIENKRILEEANRELEQKVKMIQQQLCKEKSGHYGSYVDGSQTPFLLETTAKDMFSSIATFTSLLSKYTDLNGHNVAHEILVTSDFLNRIPLLRPNHWTYILKNCICKSLFENFQSETFTGSGNAVLFLDPEQRVSICFEYIKKCKIKGGWERDACQTSDDKFDYLFFKYFASKASRILPWDIQLLMREVFKNHDDPIGTRLYERLLNLAPRHQRLVQSLMRATEKVWQFHKLCLSFEPPATIFQVASGDPFHEDYMEATDELESDDSKSVPTVGFMIYPGFRLGKSIIKSEVYLAIKT